MLEITKKSSVDFTSKLTFLFWLGFFIYTISYTFPGDLVIGVKYFQVLQVVGIAMFFSSGIFLIKWEIPSNYLKTIYVLFCVWSVITVIRGLYWDFDYIKSLFFDPLFSIFIYFSPLALLFVNKKNQIKSIFFVILVLSMFFLIYNLLFYKVAILGLAPYRYVVFLNGNFTYLLVIPSGFVLLTYAYHKRERNIFALAVLILNLFIVILRARRSYLFLTLLLLFMSLSIYLYYYRMSMFKIVFSMFIIFFVVFFSVEIYFQNPGNFFDYISNRLSEDTRSWVEGYFFRDMSNLDLIIGRGMNGEYFCPGLDESEGVFTTYRNVIETGFLHIILKGGIISLVLWLLIMIPASIKGIFLSNNLLCRAAGLWIFIFIGFTYPLVVNTFSLNYLMMWLFAGICYSKDFRLKSDKEILNELRNF